MRFSLSLRTFFVVAAAIIAFTLVETQTVKAEGSANLYPQPVPPACGTAAGNACRANLEWNQANQFYGGAGFIARRTILRVFARENEVIMIGSSGVGINRVSAPDDPNPGNAFIFAPGAVPTAPVGNEALPAFGTAVLDCMTQRGALAVPTLGFIGTRAQELAGPNIINATTNAITAGAGYNPCFYKVPVGQGGIYSVIFSGPNGTTDDVSGGLAGTIGDNAGNINGAQKSSVSMWDVTVRAVDVTDTTVAPSLTGRLFSFYLSLFTSTNARPLTMTVYLVTLDGYIYQATLRGTDPNGFVIYGNSIGFFDSDGASPLYRDIRGSNAQLSVLQGGVTIARPSFPIFFNPPDLAVFTALTPAIPTNPTVPLVSNLTFTGSAPGYTNEGVGGTFGFTSNIGANYEIILSRDGIDFEPTNPLNRVLRGVRPAGVNAIAWDGNDNSGAAFPVGGPYSIRASIRAGEYHFPLLDAENSTNGGPTVTLLNPPDTNGDLIGDCPPFTGGCSGILYDDRGYRTLNGSIVGTVNGDLCPVNATSNNNDPAILYTGITGYDSNTAQRAFGFVGNFGNANTDCPTSPPAVANAGSFGDAKGLDMWAFFPSASTNTQLIILPVGVQPPAATPTPTPTSTPTLIPGSTPEPGAAVRTPGAPGTVIGDSLCLTEAGKSLPQCVGTVLAQIEQLPATGQSPWSVWRPLILLLMPLLAMILAATLLYRRRATMN